MLLLVQKSRPLLMMSTGLYGAKRIAASLNDDKDFPPINHKKVARIMKAMGLKGFTKRR
ncbi:transposase, partial [Corynebacterium striatum]